MGRRARETLLQDAQARAGERQGLQDEEEAKQDVFKCIGSAATQAEDKHIGHP